MATVKKVYPIKGRKDFFKYVVIHKGKIARGYMNNKPNQEMYFDTKAKAQLIANAIKRVEALNKKHATTKRSKK